VAREKSGRFERTRLRHRRSNMRLRRWRPLVSAESPEPSLTRGLRPASASREDHDVALTDCRSITGPTSVRSVCSPPAAKDSLASALGSDLDSSTQVFEGAVTQKTDVGSLVGAPNRALSSVLK
jgi:hypothetical protein